MYKVLSIKFKILIVLLLAACYLLLATHANAESVSLAVDPPIFQIQATPPSNIISPLTLENRGDSPLSINIQLKPFVPSDQENGQITYIKGDIGGVQILDEGGQAINSFTLSSKEKKKLTLSISVPKDYPQGDYYFSIIFLSNSESVNINSSQSISGIASNVLLSVGSGKVSGQIEEFSAPVFIEKGPVPFTVRVKNTSNHFITPKGEILIKNLFGQTIGKVDLGGVNILSQSVRSVPSIDFLKGDNNLPSTLAAYWPEKFLLGPYKATLSVALSDTGPLFRRSIVFFAFPAQTALIGLLIIIILIYITFKVRLKI